MLYFLMVDKCNNDGKTDDQRWTIPSQSRHQH